MLYGVYCIFLYKNVNNMSCKVDNFTVLVPNSKNKWQLSTFSTELSTSESKKALQQNAVKPFIFTAYIHVYTTAYFKLDF